MLTLYHLKYNTICPFPTKICKKLHWTEKLVINYVTESNDQSFYVIARAQHGVTAHNWFAHYLWDIYGGFGYNGKIIQRTLPSQAITLRFGCLGNFSKLDALWKRNMCVKVSDTVLLPITGLRITFGTYTEALDTMGR